MPVTADARFEQDAFVPYVGRLQHRMDSDRLDGIILRSNRPRQEEFKTSVYAPSMARLLLWSAIPVLAAGAVAAYAAFACSLANPHDFSMRNLIKAAGGALIVLLAVVAVMIFLWHREQKWTLEAGRLSFLDAAGLISNAWNEIELNNEKRRFGIGQVDVVMAGKTRVLSSIFFPEFDHIQRQMKERIQLFSKVGTSVG